MPNSGATAAVLAGAQRQMRRLLATRAKSICLTRVQAEAALASLTAAPPAEVCICAAVRLMDGRIIRGHRHCHCLQICHEWSDAGQVIEVDEQGFVTSRNRFVGRVEGRELQEAAGIPSHDPSGYRGGNLLFSEDLY